eukprot:scaffold771_cov387-Prasinococcus_capsulatus_cf.AAC.6
MAKTSAVDVIMKAVSPVSIAAGADSTAPSYCATVAITSGVAEIATPCSAGLAGEDPDAATTAAAGAVGVSAARAACKGSTASRPTAL